MNLNRILAFITPFFGLIGSQLLLISCMTF